MTENGSKTGSTDKTLSPDVSGKLAPGSIWTKADQERWYLEQKGQEAADRQRYLARLNQGKCVCDRPKVTWVDEQQHKTTRILHRLTCPKHKPWMAEFLTTLT